jgi:hypothetical protein
MDERGYYRLCAGIIERAVDDYRTSLRYLLHKKIVDNDWNLKEKHFKNRHHREAWNMKMDCERFFFSQYFDYLSDTEDFGPTLVNKIREDVKNGN